MKLAKLLACGVMAAGLLSAAGIAHAADVTITNVAVGNGSGDYGSATVGGYGNLWTTPLILTDSTGHTYVTVPRQHL